MPVRFRKPIRRVRYQPIDWFRIIADLKLLGWSHGSIAFAIGAGRASSVSDYARGVTEPRYENGEKIIELWRRETNMHHPPRVQI